MSPFDASDASDVRARRHRAWWQRLLLGVGTLLSLLLFTSAALLGALELKVSKVQRIALQDVLSPTSQAVETTLGTQTPAPARKARKAINILVVGVDNADSLAADDRRRIDRDDGLRSDTIMVIRLDPSSGSAALLSFPRDLWVPVGEDGDNDRINAALPLGGPELLIRTIREDFGIPINHFVQVDFGQFEALVLAYG